MSDSNTTLAALRKRVKRFVSERDWDQFHSAKNLSMSIAIEAAELMEHFQWQDIREKKALDARARSVVEEELADIVIYALDFCNQFNIDLSKAIKRKLKSNAEKYPVGLVRGKSHKYTWYENEPGVTGEHRAHKQAAHKTHHRAGRAKAR